MENNPNLEEKCKVKGLQGYEPLCGIGDYWICSNAYGENGECEYAELSNENGCSMYRKRPESTESESGDAD